MISGAQYLVKALQEEQVEFLFNYPGAATIDIMDELYKQDKVKVILPRHEQALAHAADGYARSTGKVGVCMVTSGPGATNLVTGIATAYSDSVPLVCITGQVDLGLMGNDAFQEVDTVGIVRNICKYAVTVRDRKELGRIFYNKAVSAIFIGRLIKNIICFPLEIALILIVYKAVSKFMVQKKP